MIRRDLNLEPNTNAFNSVALNSFSRTTKIPPLFTKDKHGLLFGYRFEESDFLCVYIDGVLRSNPAQGNTTPNVCVFINKYLLSCAYYIGVNNQTSCLRTTSIISFSSRNVFLLFLIFFSSSPRHKQEPATRFVSFIYKVDY
jgi:hypothetical protein